MVPYRLTFILTYQCNLACMHCLFDCGPARKEALSVLEVKNYINQAKAVSTMKLISFSGGEPFLILDDLRGMVEHASRLGFDTECVTNCFWATGEVVASRQLLQLKDAGLDLISISVDDFHQQQVPFSHIRNAYWAARALGLRIALLISTSKSSKLRGLELPRQIGDINIHNIKKRAGRDDGAAGIVIESSFIPIGRALGIPVNEREVSGKLRAGPCKAVLRELTILPSGVLLPCCSVAGLAEPAVVGSLRNSSLAELIHKARNTILFQILAREGPLDLQGRLGYDPKAGYINECHLCYELLNDSRFEARAPFK